MLNKLIALAVLMLAAGQLAGCAHKTPAPQPQPKPQLQAQVQSQPQAISHDAREAHRRWLNAKTDDEYHAMDTEKLAEEMLGGNFVRILLSCNDSRPEGQLRDLCGRLPGFAEFASRPDLWRGILHAYEYNAAKLSPGNDQMTLMDGSFALSHMGILFEMPEFQAQLKGREPLFFKAHLKLLRNLAELSRQRWEFPTVAVRAMYLTLPLAERTDPATFAEIRPELAQILFDYGLTLTTATAKGNEYRDNLEKLVGLLERIKIGDVNP